MNESGTLRWLETIAQKAGQAFKRGPAAHACDDTFYLYKSDYFQEMLALERKRTERSHKPIVLFLIDIHRLFAEMPRSEVAKRIHVLLEKTTREIDIRGWYQNGHTVGIIYTEVSEGGIDPIEEKNRDALSVLFGKRLCALIDTACMLFPDDKNEFQDSSTIADIRFYLDNRRPSAARAMYHMAKRLLDIAGSLFLILLFLPLLLTIPVLIKLLSPGPVFYTQKRVGQRGSLFTFIKFRSMRVDSDSTVHQQYIRRLIAGNNHAGTPGVYKLQNDPRVTSLGRILRKTSLDELPQLFNVLMGDMSLVGPRPALPYEITHYRLWHWRRVLEIKPGLTGFWQVEGRSNSDFETMVRMDLCYIRHQNLLWDLALIFRTPRAMIRGAY